MSKKPYTRKGLQQDKESEQVAADFDGRKKKFKVSTKKKKKKKSVKKKRTPQNKKNK